MNKTFEQRLDGLFEQAERNGNIIDTIWLSNLETFHDAILRIYYDWEEE